jgi:alpha-N-arabinofuranosidase
MRISVFTSYTGYVYENSGQDYHQYTRPDRFVQQFNYFDNFANATGHPIMVGEFAVVQNNTGNPGDGTNWSNPKK